MLVKFVKRLYRAALHSFKGFRAAFEQEFAFRLEVALTCFVVPLSFMIGDDATQYSLLLGSWLLIPIIELINSALEAAVDRIGLEHHELSGRAKDLGSAAVFLACVNAAIVWLLIFILA